MFIRVDEIFTRGGMSMSERKSVNIGRIVICILIFLTVGVMITPVVASDWTTPTPLLSGMPDIPVKDEFHFSC